MKTLVLIFSISILSLDLYADEFEWTSDCDRDQNSTNTCAANKFKYYDAEINRVYKEKMSSLSDKDKNRLRAAQRIWVKNRDPDCEKYATEEVDRGSMWPMIYHLCRARVTKERTAEIARWPKK